MKLSSTRHPIERGPGPGLGPVDALQTPARPFGRILGGLLLLVAGVVLGSLPRSAQAQDAAALKARHSELRDKLANNQFQRPLYLESSQTSGDLRGDVYAVVDQPFAVVLAAMQGIDHWCDILILHLNVKMCTAAPQVPGSVLRLNVGRKIDQPIEDAYQVDFDYKTTAVSASFLRVQLNAESGPLGTKNYRIVLEAIPIDDRHSFLHMAYSYAYGFAARMAMEGYLGTIGRDKVGFSIVGQKDGQPVYIGNVRGVLERNTMRYYLAIEAYLNAPQPNQTEKRLNDWFSSVERYPQQLHELGRNEYLEMKHREVQRQREGAKNN